MYDADKGQIEGYLTLPYEWPFNWPWPILAAHEAEHVIQFVELHHAVGKRAVRRQMKTSTDVEFDYLAEELAMRAEWRFLQWIPSFWREQMLSEITSKPGESARTIQCIVEGSFVTENEHIRLQRSAGRHDREDLERSQAQRIRGNRQRLHYRYFCFGVLAVVAVLQGFDWI